MNIGNPLRKKSPISRYNVTLQDGSTVDVCSEEGANAFLRQASSSNCDLISSTLKKIQKIYNKKKRLNRYDKGVLLSSWLLICGFISQADRDIFRKAIEDSEIQFWLEYVIEDIKKLTAKRTWQQSGTLGWLEDSALFSSSCMVKHAVPVVLAFESELFSVLADFVKACKGSGRGLPSEEIAKMITEIVHGAFVASTNLFDHPWSAEKVFKKLEASGILGEFLRCMTVPQPTMVDQVGFILNELASCPSFLRKKFKIGESCGDVLLAILEGKDGHRNTPATVTKGLQGLFHSLQAITKPKCDEARSWCMHCRKAERSEAPLMKCSRCLFTTYCSKECQIADWKDHKKGCFPISKTDLKKKTGAAEMLQKFVEKHGDRVESTMIEECQRKGLKRHNMVIELDFMPNKDGIIPAMSDSPSSFRITSIHEIANAPRSKHPWLSKVDKKTFDDIINLFQEKSKKKKEGFETFSVLYNYAGGIGTSHAEMPYRV
mmetsp:Transcript_27215/g.66047  ORF Transcript_27215/g.66047 Transcript_27215/m.66047 type:complete len:489 (+) Transcript_27215:793-2259(+)